MLVLAMNGHNALTGTCARFNDACVNVGLVWRA